MRQERVLEFLRSFSNDCHWLRVFVWCSTKTFEWGKIWTSNFLGHLPVIEIYSAFYFDAVQRPQRNLDEAETHIMRRQRKFEFCKWFSHVCNLLSPLLWCTTKTFQRGNKSYSKFEGHLAVNVNYQAFCFDVAQRHLIEATKYTRMLKVI